MRLPKEVREIRLNHLLEGCHGMRQVLCEGYSTVISAEVGLQKTGKYIKELLEMFETCAPSISLYQNPQDGAHGRTNEDMLEMFGLPISHVSNVHA